jgi:hypothetical protein
MAKGTRQKWAGLLLFCGSLCWAQLYWAQLCWAQSDARAIFEEIGKDLGELTEITGLKIHHKVPFDLITKDQVNQFLKDRVHDATTPEDLRIEELGLKKFGFVPQDFDLAKTTVDLLTEQAGGGLGSRAGARLGRPALSSRTLHQTRPR